MNEIRMTTYNPHDQKANISYLYKKKKNTIGEKKGWWSSSGPEFKTQYHKTQRHLKINQYS
jgi:hypothetical protein